ncbi:hypothetical protein HDU96_003815 [Phlyctochytrium bullatum]|nr:hypothetical protein HDU96_003815 [Phlyctochytrium bullatum]
MPPSTSTTTSLRPTSLAVPFTDPNRQDSRTPHDHLLALDIWRIPATPRATTYPRSRFTGVNVRYDFFIADPEPCDPAILAILHAGPGRSLSVSCGLGSLDEALEVCDWAPSCSGVMDRNGTYSWKEVNQTRPKNTSQIVDSFYAFYYPTETAFLPLKSWRDLSGADFNPLVFVSGIYGGSAFRMPEGYLPSPYSEPNRDLSFVIVSHIIGFVLLLLLYCWVMGIWVWRRAPAPAAGSHVDVELELEAILSFRPRGADQQPSLPPPIYSEATAVAGGRKPGATRQEGVLYI